MRLTRRAARIYQYTAFFFSTVSLIFINHPAIFLAPVFILLTLTLYVFRSIWALRRISEKDFEVFLTISPNILTVNDKSRVRVYVQPRLDSRLKTEVNIQLSEGLKIESGEAARSGVISRKNNITLEFTVNVQRSGLLEVGPVEVVVKDDLELVCKTITIDSLGMIYSFEEPMRTRSVVIASSSAGLNYPGYSLHPFIGVKEEYRESLRSEHQSLRNVDWRRTARTNGEEVYVREYDRRRSSYILIGYGSGLDLEMPQYGNILNWIMGISMSYALHYLREGSRIWLINYNDGKPAISEMTLRYGEFNLRKNSIPSGGYLIYISRLVDPEELNVLRRYLGNENFRVNILLLDLLDEVSSLVEDRVINYEAERLKRAASIIQDPVTIVKLRDFMNSFKRCLASRWGR
ncbi:MAG: DUF58 domain-containing protein [Nitrososphaerota archaeon]